MNYNRISQIEARIAKNQKKLSAEKDSKKKQILNLKISIDELKTKLERLKVIESKLSYANNDACGGFEVYDQQVWSAPFGFAGGSNPYSTNVNTSLYDSKGEAYKVNEKKALICNL